MRDAKYVESRCFHTGVVPEVVKQLKHPIMLKSSAWSIWCLQWLYRMVSHPSNRVPDTCRIYSKEHWSCSGGSGGSWEPNTLLIHFMLMFPLFWQLPVFCSIFIQQVSLILNADWLKAHSSRCLFHKLPRAKSMTLKCKYIQCLAKVFGPLELCDLLPHFRLQT